MDSAKGLSDSFSYAFPIFCYNSDIAKFETWYLKKEILQLFLFVYVFNQNCVSEMSSWRWTSSISGLNQRGTMQDFYKGLHTFTTFSNFIR